MTLTNVKETISLPAYRLLPNDLTLSEVILKQSQAAIDSGNKDQSSVEKVRQVCGRTVCEHLDRFNVQLPTEIVTIEISVASLLCDLYVPAHPAPQAPLLARDYHQKLQKKRMLWEKEPISLETAFKEAIKKTMSEPALWNAVQVTGRVQVKDTHYYLGMSPEVLGQVPSVFDAIMSLFPAEQAGQYIENKEDVGA